ncbi:MAG: D-amino-acid transaminase [Hyphomicrobiaceae bacterium]|jgi:D-alanine transaminase
MARVVYVNGRFVPWRDAAVHAEDRGFQFADAVYEVCEVRGGRLVDETRHLARLERSLGELGMAMPMTRWALGVVLRETIRRNRVRSGTVYLQVTRGAAPRDFLFPSEDVSQTVVCVARPARMAGPTRGIGVVTAPEMRWGRCDIKTVMLLPAVLAKETARAAGAREAWFVDEDGLVTEGASSNAWIVTADGLLVTRPADTTILRGVTRTTLEDVARSLGVSVVERAFTVAEAHAAREAFITSASNIVMPVVRIDGVAIGGGEPGPVALRLRQTFHDVAEIALP